jgi:phosphoribosyl 1,2-cyclic phosphodiesterase
MFKVLFLGTGVSTAVPNLYHVVIKGNDQCAVCLDAWRNPHSKNRRNNVSIAVLVNDSETGIERCIVVDVGKTMREAMMRHFPVNNIRRVDSILLTHGHADALFGLDDVRDLQECTSVVVQKDGQDVVGAKVLSGPLSIYLHQETMNTVKQAFGYLTNAPEYLDEENFILERRIALLNFKVIEPRSDFLCHGLQVRSFPVYHGGTYISLGFSFGKEGEFIYISDVKIIPEDTMNYLKSIPKIKTLVLDCLSDTGIFSHFSLEEALATADILKPENLYLTGMGCGFGLHEDRQVKLSMQRPNTYLAYDGLMLDGYSLAYVI